MAQVIKNFRFKTCVFHKIFCHMSEYCFTFSEQMMSSLSGLELWWSVCLPDVTLTVGQPQVTFSCAAVGLWVLHPDGVIGGRDRPCHHEDRGGGAGGGHGGGGV